MRSPSKIYSGTWISKLSSPDNGNKEQTRAEYDAFLAEKVHPILEEWKAKILTGEWLEPQLIYGYFPCTAEGNSVHVYDPSVIEQGLTPQTATPVITWTFPRQKSLRRLCLADFFRLNKLPIYYLSFKLVVFKVERQWLFSVMLFLPIIMTF